jgi:hypothetical protein
MDIDGLFVKGWVEGPTMANFYGELKALWLMPVVKYTPPYGSRSADFQHTEHQDVAEKAQKIFDAGFHFTFEILRMVNKGSFCIVGKCQRSPGESPEEDDVAMVITNPDRSHYEAVDKCIRDFVIPEDGIVRRY